MKPRYDSQSAILGDITIELLSPNELEFIDFLDLSSNI